MDEIAAQTVLYVSDGEDEEEIQEVSVAVIEKKRRSSKDSLSSIASSVSGVVADAPQLKGEATSPRIAELRLDVNVGTTTSGRDSSDILVRSSVRSSPGSPRKMLASTPVTGSCDFQGMIPAHHARRLSSRSASSPRLVISGISPKQSPKDNQSKVSPRDGLHIAVPKAASRLLHSPSVTTTVSPVTRSSTEHAHLHRSPQKTPGFSSVKIKAERRAISSEERRVEKRSLEVVIPTTGLLLRAEEMLSGSRAHHRYTKSDIQSAGSLPGYPLQPSLETRKAAFEKLHVQVLRRGPMTSILMGENGVLDSDQDSVSLATGVGTNDSAKSPSKIPRRSSYLNKATGRRIRRYSDPCLPYTSPWPTDRFEDIARKDVRQSTFDVVIEAPTRLVIDSGRPAKEALRPTPLVPPEPLTMNASSNESEQPPSASRSPISPFGSFSPPTDPNPSSRFVASVSIVEATVQEELVFQQGEQRRSRGDTLIASRSISDAASTPASSPFFTGQGADSPNLLSTPTPDVMLEESRKRMPKKKRSSLLANFSTPLKDSFLGRSTSPLLHSLKRKTRAQSVQSPPSPAHPVVTTSGIRPPASPPKSRSLRLGPAASEHKAQGGSSSIFSRSSRSKSPSSKRRGSITSPTLPVQGSKSLSSSSLALDVVTTSTEILGNPSQLPAPSPLPKGLLSVSRASSMPTTQQQHYGDDELHGSGIKKSSSFASSLFPAVIRERSPASSPTTTRSKRRPSFNFTAFDATVAALKQKFRRKNSIPTPIPPSFTPLFRESVSTPNSPLVRDDRRTLPSNSMGSLYSETSEDGRFQTVIGSGRGNTTSSAGALKQRRGTALNSATRYYLENRRNSDTADSVMDLEDDSDSDGDASFKASSALAGFLEETDDDEDDHEGDNRVDTEENDAALAGVLNAGTVDEILVSIGHIKTRKRRLEALDALFLSAADFFDSSGEQMTSKVADYVEDSGDLDALERWLIGFRVMDKLRFYDPSLVARVREVIDFTVSILEETARAMEIEKKLKADAHMAELMKGPAAAMMHPPFNLSAFLSDQTQMNDSGSVVRINDEEVRNVEEEEELSSEVDGGMSSQFHPHRPSRHSRLSSSMISSSSSSSSDEDEDEDETGGGDTEATENNRRRRGGLRMLRMLNHSDALDVADLHVGSNEWEHDFEEERKGGPKRRKSETNLPTTLILADEDESVNLVRHRRAYSLPFLLLWSQPSSSSAFALPAATTPTALESTYFVEHRRRDLSAGSYGSFSARSSSFHSVSYEGFQRQKEQEEEEKDTMVMLGLAEPPPIASPLKAGATSSDVLTMPPNPSPGSPLSPFTMMSSMNLGASNTNQPAGLMATSSRSGQHRRTLSIGEDSTTQYYYYSNTHPNRGTLTAYHPDDSGDDTTTTATALSPRSHELGHLNYFPSSSQQRRMTASSIASLSTSQRQRSSTHVKQASSSSLQTLKTSASRHLSSSGGYTGRRSAVSSSFSSFVFMDAETFALPDIAFRNDIKRYDPNLVAEQLTMTMCRMAYFRITQAALRTTETRKRDVAVQRMMRYFEILSTWPVTEVLMDPKRTASDRIDHFGFFVSLAQACREAGNYHAVFALVGGLQSPLLIWVTEIAHRKDKKRFQALKRLVRTDNNYKVYHADLSKRSPKKPCIPYLGLLNRTLVSLQYETPVFLDNDKRVINFMRCRRISTAIRDFLRWQGPSGAAALEDPYHSSAAVLKGLLQPQKSSSSLKDTNERKESGFHLFPQSGVFLDPCIRKALAASMGRSVLDYRELSSMSSEAKSWYLKSMRQRAFHRARILGHQIVGNES